MSNPYPFGQCTWGAAEMCSCLQNIGKYGNFGNGGDWYQHAQQIGLPTSKQPQVGWLASFAVSGWPAGPGDVGLIIGINTDGTITRYGTNWHLDGSWSTDKVSASLVTGCFKPPCDCVGPAGQLFSSNPNQPQGALRCHTFKWQATILGQEIDFCFDPLIGMTAIGGGILIMTVGLLVMVMASTRIKPPKQQPSPDGPQQPQNPESQQQPQQQPAQPAQSATTPTGGPQRISPEQADAIAVRARQRAVARRAVTGSGVASSGPSEAKRLRAEIAAARRDRTAANKSGNTRAWTDATVRMNVAQNRLSAIGGK